MCKANLSRKSDRRRRLSAFLSSHWAECCLAVAMLAAMAVSGCDSFYMWHGPDGHVRYTSDPPESYPVEERAREHPAFWR